MLVDPQTHVLNRRLTRNTALQRHNEGARTPQLAAANVDTLFIVTSCNADFNAARLERYLALANQAGTNPVILLTKVDATDDAKAYQQKAAALQRGLAVVDFVPLFPRRRDGIGSLVWGGADSGVGGILRRWQIDSGQYSGGTTQSPPQRTGKIRENDAKGRHTTTSRSIHAIAGGGWVIDTPGMRTLHISNAAHGVSTLFAEITELAPLCRFRDCTHAHEPGCAVQAAVIDGTLDPERLARWRKLMDENSHSTPNKTVPHRGGGVAVRSKKR